MTRIGILHTSPATIDVFKPLVAELLPGAEVINFVDDSILPELARNGGDVEAVADRLVHYARFAEQAGADVILSACSSVGEVVARERAAVGVPVVRVDEALAEAAVQRGRVIGVAATLATTLNPTLALLRAKAAEAGRAVELKPRLVNAAFERLMAGDKEGHDELLAAALAELAAASEVVVLAQASMARVLPRLPEAARAKALTSPRLALGAVQRALSERHAAGG